jgi:hypothetical protein
VPVVIGGTPSCVSGAGMVVQPPTVMAFVSDDPATTAQKPCFLPPKRVHRNGPILDLVNQQVLALRFGGRHNRVISGRPKTRIRPGHFLKQESSERSLKWSTRRQTHEPRNVTTRLKGILRRLRAAATIFQSADTSVCQIVSLSSWLQSGHRKMESRNRHRALAR